MLQGAFPGYRRWRATLANAAAVSDSCLASKSWSGSVTHSTAQDRLPRQRDEKKGCNIITIPSAFKKKIALLGMLSRYQTHTQNR